MVEFVFYLDIVSREAPAPPERGKGRNNSFTIFQTHSFSLKEIFFYEREGRG